MMLNEILRKGENHGSNRYSRGIRSQHAVH